MIRSQKWLWCRASHSVILVNRFAKSTLRIVEEDGQHLSRGSMWHVDSIRLNYAKNYPRTWIKTWCSVLRRVTHCGIAFAFWRRFETASAHGGACGEACAAGSFEAGHVDMTHMQTFCSEFANFQTFSGLNHTWWRLTLQRLRKEPSFFLRCQRCLRDRLTSHWCLVEVSTLPKKSSSARRSRDSQFSLGLELPLLGSVNGAALHVASRNVGVLTFCHRWCAGGRGCHFGQCGWHFSGARWRMLWYHHSSRPRKACHLKQLQTSVEKRWNFASSQTWNFNRNEKFDLSVWARHQLRCFIRRWRGDWCDRWRCRHCYTSRRHGLGCKDQKYLKKIQSSSRHAGGLFGCVFQFTAILEVLRLLPGDRCQGGDQSPSNHEPRRSRRRLGKEGSLTVIQVIQVFFSCPGSSCCLWRHLCLRYSMVGSALDGKNQGWWACLQLRTVWFVSTKGTFVAFISESSSPVLY